MTKRAGILVAVGATVAGLVTAAPSTASAPSTVSADAGAAGTTRRRAAHVDELRDEVVSEAPVCDRAGSARP